MNIEELKNSYPINTFSGTTRKELEELIDRAVAAENERCKDICKTTCFCKDANHTGGICPIGEGMSQAIERRDEV